MKKKRYQRKKHKYSEHKMEELNKDFETKVQDKHLHNKGFKHRDFFNV